MLSTGSTGQSFLDKASGARCEGNGAPNENGTVDERVWLVVLIRAEFLLFEYTCQAHHRDLLRLPLLQLLNIPSVGEHSAESRETQDMQCHRAG
jgi:hypothetical protein